MMESAVAAVLSREGKILIAQKPNGNIPTGCRSLSSSGKPVIWVPKQGSYCHPCFDYISAIQCLSNGLIILCPG